MVIVPGLDFGLWRNNAQDVSSRLVLLLISSELAGFKNFGFENAI